MPIPVAAAIAGLRALLAQSGPLLARGGAKAAQMGAEALEAAAPYARAGAQRAQQMGAEALEAATPYAKAGAQRARDFGNSAVNAAQEFGAGVMNTPESFPLDGAAVGTGRVVGGVARALPGQAMEVGRNASRFMQEHPLATMGIGLGVPPVTNAILKSGAEAESVKQAQKAHSTALTQAGDYEVYNEYLDGVKFPPDQRLSAREFATIRNNPALLKQFTQAH